MFKGLGNANPDQFWFVARDIWEAQGVTYDHINKVMLVSTLQDHMLTWYIKYSNYNPNARVADIQVALNREFSWLKSETQSIIGFKDIVMLPGEIPWDLDHVSVSIFTLPSVIKLLFCKYIRCLI